MLVVEYIAKGSWRLCLNPYIEGVTVGQFGLSQAMLSKQRDSCLSPRRPTGVKLEGRVGGGLLLGTNVLEGENGGVWCW